MRGLKPHPNSLASQIPAARHKTAKTIWIYEVAIDRYIVRTEVCVSPLLRSAGVPSSASGLPAVDHRPAPRCVADAGHPARPLSPAVAARREPAPIRLADSVDWSATPSSGLRPHSSLRGGWVDPRPAVRLVCTESHCSYQPAIPANPVHIALTVTEVSRRIHHSRSRVWNRRVTPRTPFDPRVSVLLHPTFERELGYQYQRLQLASTPHDR